MEKATFTGTSTFQLPIGFRFHPSDEELIVHYLRNKVISHPLPAQLITEIDLYKYNPWELPNKALFGEDEWYFFSPRDRKYPNGVRPNRAAASGYWKAACSDKPILTYGSKCIGVKKALVFYRGRAPKGLKTEWIMNEYRLLDSTVSPSRLKGSMRLDDWVLCRVQRRGNTTKNTCNTQDRYNTEFWRCLPKVEQAQPYANHHADIITDFIYEDCPLLASILSGQTPPAIQTNSSLSFQGGIDGYEVVSNNNKVKSTISISSSGINSNTLKRKTRDENTNGDLFPLSNNLENKNNDEHLLPSQRLAGNVINCHIPNHFQNNILKANPMETANFKEFNEMTFLGTYFE